MIEGGSYKLEIIVSKRYLNPKLVQSPPPAADVWWVNNHFLRQVDKSIINPAGRASKESERIIFLLKELSADSWECFLGKEEGKNKQKMNNRYIRIPSECTKSSEMNIAPVIKQS